MMGEWGLYINRPFSVRLFKWGIDYLNGELIIK